MTSSEGTLAAREERWAWLFIAPPLLGFLAFAFGPMLASLYLSFTKYSIWAAPTWTGLDNYRQLFSSDPFLAKTVWNTVYYFIGIPIGLALSLGLALILNQKLKFENFFRTVFFLPSVCSAVALGVVWQWIYNNDYGLINTTFRHMPNWLGDPHWVKPSLVALGVWGGLGYNMVLFLAALQGMPKGVLEAALIDGATGWQRFRSIILPLISPTTFFIVVMSVIGGFQNFDQIWIMTRGGPEYASASYMIYLYQNAFQYYRMGYASAMAWLLAAVIGVITVVQFKLSQRWVHYD